MCRDDANRPSSTRIISSLLFRWWRAFTDNAAWVGDLVTHFACCLLMKEAFRRVQGEKKSAWSNEMNEWKRSRIFSFFASAHKKIFSCFCREHTVLLRSSCYFSKSSAAAAQLVCWPISEVSGNFRFSRTKTSTSFSIHNNETFERVSRRRQLDSSVSRKLDLK